MCDSIENQGQKLYFSAGKRGNIFPQFTLGVIFLLTVLVSFSTMSLAVENATEALCAAITPLQPNEVKSSIAGISIDETKSTSQDMAEIAGLYNGIDKSIGGLTSAEPLLEYEVDPNLSLMRDREGVCARPSIRLTIGYSAMKIYMDREIPHSSCIYNAIFAHEMHHVAIYKDYISRNIEQIRQTVENKFNGSTYFFQSISEAKQYTGILGQVLIQHIREKFLSDVYAEQSALDSETEYRRMQNQCFH
jgi:hypothetical protein